MAEDGNNSGDGGETAVVAKAGTSDALTNEEWATVTVEDFLNRQCDRLLVQIDDHAKSLCDQLRKHMQEGAVDVMSVTAQRKPAAPAGGQTSSSGEAKMGSSRTAAAGGGNTDNANTSAVYNVEVEVSSGPYKGKTFTLKTSKHDVLVGRSAGKKFAEKNLSLSKDTEISTTHGKFEIRSGKLFYTDMGSTNGSQLEGNDLVAYKPYELTVGSILLLGVSSIKIAVVLKQ